MYERLNKNTIFLCRHPEVDTSFPCYHLKIAEKEVENAMEKTRKMVGLAPEEYRIKKTKSVWGRCSTTRKITINQNLMMYSRKAIEYVVLHEITHLKHMNHSKEFWNMVECYMPNYKEIRKQLKDN